MGHDGSEIETTYSLVEQRKLISPAQHRQHEHEHRSGRGYLRSVLEERKGDEGVFVNVPLPCAEGDCEEAAEDKEEDDPPVCR